MEVDIEAAANELADRMEQAGKADLVAEYARLLPLMVICDLLGLPRNDRAFFIESANSFSDVTGLLSFFSMIPALRRLSSYLDGKIQEARQSGGSGLIGALIKENEDGHANDDELLATAFLLLIAGHETTTHLISGSVKTLFDETDKRAWLMQDPNRLDLAVEEFLRFVTPVQMTKPRHARADVDVAGMPVRRGELVMPLLAAANADPEVFDRPEDLLLDRHPNPHLAFGTGVHFCLGHQLARLEARIALQTLFERFPDINLDRGAGPLRWRKRVGLRALTVLPVVLQ